MGAGHMNQYDHCKAFACLLPAPGPCNIMDGVGGKEASHQLMETKTHRAIVAYTGLLSICDGMSMRSFASPLLLQSQASMWVPFLVSILRAAAMPVWRMRSPPMHAKDPQVSH